MKNTLIISFLFFGFIACKPDKPTYGTNEWREYLGGPERNHYSPLNQLDRNNVQQLKVAWEYHSV
jgi:quinoprotein glucose dehydrogenase